MSCHLPVRRRRRLRPLPDLGCQHRLGLTRRLSVPIFHRLAVCPTIIRMVLPVQTCHHILSIWLITISCLLTSALLAYGGPSPMACVPLGSVTGKSALRIIGTPPLWPPPPPTGPETGSWLRSVLHVNLRSRRQVLDFQGNPPMSSFSVDNFVDRRRSGRQSPRKIKGLATLPGKVAVR